MNCRFAQASKITVIQVDTTKARREVKLTSHLSRAYKTVFNMFSYNRKYPIHSEIIISTCGTGRSISSTFPFKTVITAHMTQIEDESDY